MSGHSDKRTGRVPSGEELPGQGRRSRVAQSALSDNRFRGRLQDAALAAVLAAGIKAVVAHAEAQGVPAYFFTFTSRHRGTPDAVMNDMKACWWRFQQTRVWRKVSAAVWVFGDHGHPHLHLAVVLPEGVTIRAFRTKWTGGISTHPPQIYDAEQLGSYFGAQRTSFVRNPTKRRRYFGSRLPSVGHLAYVYPSANQGSTLGAGPSPSTSRSSSPWSSEVIVPTSGSSLGPPLAPSLVTVTGETGLHQVRAETGGEGGSSLPTMRRPASPTSCCISSSDRAQPGGGDAEPEQVGGVEQASPPRGSEPLHGLHSKQMSVAAVMAQSTVVNISQGVAMSYSPFRRSSPQQIAPQTTASPSGPDQHQPGAPQAMQPDSVAYTGKPFPSHGQPIPEPGTRLAQAAPQMPQATTQPQQNHQFQQPAPIQAQAPFILQQAQSIAPPVPCPVQVLHAGPPMAIASHQGALSQDPAAARQTTWIYNPEGSPQPASAAPERTWIYNPGGSPQPASAVPQQADHVEQLPAPTQYTAQATPHICRCGQCGRQI